MSPLVGRWHCRCSGAVTLSANERWQWLLQEQIVPLQSCNTLDRLKPRLFKYIVKSRKCSFLRDVAPHVTKLRRIRKKQDKILIWRKKSCFSFDCESCLAAVLGVCMFPLGPAAVCNAVPLLGIWLLLGYLGSSSKQMPRADQTAWNLGVFLLYLCGLWCDQEYFSG